MSLAGGNTTLRPAEGVQYFWADEDMGDTEQARAHLAPRAGRTPFRLTPKP